MVQILFQNLGGFVLELVSKSGCKGSIFSVALSGDFCTCGLLFINKDLCDDHIIVNCKIGEFEN